MDPRNYIHTKARMKSRYNMIITQEDYDLMCQSIEFIYFKKKQTTNKYEGILVYKNIEILCIFSKKGNVITVLPKYLIKKFKRNCFNLK